MEENESTSVTLKVPCSTTNGIDVSSPRRAILSKRSSQQSIDSGSGVQTFRKDDGTMVVQLKFSQEEFSQEGFHQLLKHFTVTNTSTAAAMIDTTMPPMTSAVTIADRNKHRVSTVKLNSNAFHFKQNGEPRLSPNAAYVAKSTATSAIISAILSAGNQEQQALALHSALENEELQDVSAAACMRSKDMEAKLFIFEQIKEMLELATKRNSQRGPTDQAKASLVDNVLIASLPNLIVGPNQILIPDPLAPSSRMIANALGFKKSTGCRLLNRLQKKRHELCSTGNGHRWFDIIKRKRKAARKINPEIRKAICDWIVNHPNVVHSPIASDTILVKTSENEKTRVGKLLLEIPVRELHNQMVEADTGLLDARDPTTGKVLVSNTSLRSIIKADLPHLRRMTLRHKLMCGCETCISIATMQRSLNAWRRRRLQQIETDANQLANTRAKEVALQYVAEYHSYVLQDGKPRHEKPRHALEEIMCPSHLCGHPHWNCVLGRCKNCPSYNIHTVEQDSERKIKFHYYEYATKCSKHGDLNLRAKQCDRCDLFPLGQKQGQVRTRKHLALKEEAIEDFFNEFYIPKLKEYRYHLPHVKILSHTDCCQLRNEYFRRFAYNVKSRRDYAERLSGHFTLEIQSAHFGQGRDVSIEGSSIRTCTIESLQQYEDGEINEGDIERTLETHSHFSDDSRQDASTTHAHMDLLIKRLKEDGRIKEYVTKFLEETDGCSKQYRCATACFLLSLLASTHKIIIDRAIGAPGHGKDEVDGLNATDKRYLSEKMSVIYEPEVKEAENRMAPEARENGKSKSFAGECVRLCSLPHRFEGVKSESKSKKREDN
jgi:hypothetical protein